MNRTTEVVLVMMIDLVGQKCEFKKIICQLLEGKTLEVILQTNRFQAEVLIIMYS